MSKADELREALGGFNVFDPSAATGSNWDVFRKVPPADIARAIVSTLGITREMVGVVNDLNLAFIGAGMDEDEVLAMLNTIDALTALLEVAGR